MSRVDRGESGVMSEVGATVKSRRERLGLAINELAEEAEISRDTLSDLETGRKDYRQLTLAKVQRALTRLEEEAGINAPGPVPSVVEGLVELDLTIEPGARAVVKGPVANLPELREQLELLVRNIRAELAAGGNNPEG